MILRQPKIQVNLIPQFQRTIISEKSFKGNLKNREPCP